jgi:hypothetical protein
MLLDGMPVDAEFLYHYAVSEVDFIDILQSSAAGIYGAMGGNGIIAVYTKTRAPDPGEEERKGMISFFHRGYSPRREFFSPKYDIEDESHVKPDYRRTLHWEPTLTTNDRGNVEFSFFTSDESADYRVEIEVMIYSGIPVVREYFFSVE